MYINERDQINYHGFLRTLREMNQVSQEAVSKGICTVSGMNRFENGNRIAEKLMRDRLTSRLGISGEKYEDYLQPKEYARWKQRLEIVKAIEKRELEKAKAELASYQRLDGLNKINQQFIETMHFMILSLEHADDMVCLEYVNRAIKCTIPNVSAALQGEHLLADQEINLIAEQIRLSVPQSVVCDEKTWQRKEYEKLLSYMENSQWEKLQKAKVYPKVVYYLCQLFLSDDYGEQEYRLGLELCHNAIELLRDTGRLYYFIELTEARRAFAEHLMNCGTAYSEKSQLEEMLVENNTWEKVFRELYAEYHVAPYMSDFCYLYYETECHDMAEVIETRRAMLGLSRVKLAEGICSDRTITRLEREGRNPSMEVVRMLFEKMGLCAEYRRARVVTNDVNALMLSIEVTKNMNNYEFENWEKNLEKLENSLYMSIPHNKQEISRLRAMLKHRSKQMDNDTFYLLSQEALEYTLPITALKKEGKKYLSRNEIDSLYDFSFETKGELSEYTLQIIKEKYGTIVSEKEIDPSQLCVYEFITEGLESYFGNCGNYEESNKISHIMLKECLTHRKMRVIANKIYNLVWNYQQTQSYQDAINTYIKEQLYKCWIISKLNKRNHRAAFFQEKLDKVN